MTRTGAAMTGFSGYPLALSSGRAAASWRTKIAVKKPSVCVRRGAEELAHARRSVDRFAPDLGAGPNGEIAMRRESRDAILVLARQDRAGRIDQPPAVRMRAAACASSLSCSAMRSPQELRRETPAQLRLPAPCARAAARRIDQNGIEQPVRRFPFSQICLDDRGAGARGARGEFLQAVGGCRRRRSRPGSASRPPAPATCRPRPPRDRVRARRASLRTAAPRSAPPRPGIRTRRFRTSRCGRVRLSAPGSDADAERRKRRRLRANPRARSAASTSPRSRFSVFTRRSTGARDCSANISSSRPSPNARFISGSRNAGYSPRAHIGGGIADGACGDGGAFRIRQFGGSIAAAGERAAPASSPSASSDAIASARGVPSMRQASEARWRWIAIRAPQSRRDPSIRRSGACGTSRAAAGRPAGLSLAIVPVCRWPLECARRGSCARYPHGDEDHRRAEQGHDRRRRARMPMMAFGNEIGCAEIKKTAGKYREHRAHYRHPECGTTRRKRTQHGRQRIDEQPAAAPCRQAPPPQR